MTYPHDVQFTPLSLAVPRQPTPRADLWRLHVPEPPGQDPEVPPQPPGQPGREIDLPPLEDPNEIREPEIPPPDDAPEPDPDAPPPPLH